MESKSTGDGPGLHISQSPSLARFFVQQHWMDSSRGQTLGRGAHLFSRSRSLSRRKGRPGPSHRSLVYRAMLTLHESPPGSSLNTRSLAPGEPTDAIPFRIQYGGVGRASSHARLSRSRHPLLRQSLATPIKRHLARQKRARTAGAPRKPWPDRIYIMKR